MKLSFAIMAALAGPSFAVTTPSHAQEKLGQGAGFIRIVGDEKRRRHRGSLRPQARADRGDRRPAGSTVFPYASTEARLRAGSSDGGVPIVTGKNVITARVVVSYLVAR